MASMCHKPGIILFKKTLPNAMLLKMVYFHFPISLAFYEIDKKSQPLWAFVNAQRLNKNTKITNFMFNNHNRHYSLGQIHHIYERAQNKLDFNCGHRSTYINEMPSNDSSTFYHKLSAYNIASARYWRQLSRLEFIFRLIGFAQWENPFDWNCQ